MMAWGYAFSKPPTLNWRSVRASFAPSKVAKTSSTSTASALAAEASAASGSASEDPKITPGLNDEAERGLHELTSGNDGEHDACAKTSWNSASFDVDEVADITLPFFRDLLTDKLVAAVGGTSATTGGLSDGPQRGTKRKITRFFFKNQALEHIEGADCDSSDVDLVARAVKALINLKAPPTATLGRFGGDTSSIVHSFFCGWLPNASYRSDQDFFNHIRNIFHYLRMDFPCDLSSYDRFLCLSDFSPDNFKKTTTPDGQSVVVALDFGATCFMPLPFIEVALKKDRDSFRRLLITKLKEEEYPRGEPDHVAALLSASAQLVGYGMKPIALPHGVSRIISSR
ncbi:hypothetical protein MIND_00960700 [Mycena indigotica]|uniref:Uncharacterized protein n=1 Tax=Mycena indigotica TaxID=2126181 RepID=A0A8H6SD04_9AGAR|nr:uncharacterized protein MIND_00960700 [Mycena indigotica]KAF7297275.1 hypothetical protein MIND_00960700 [Mycena indigotica]